MNPVSHLLVGWVVANTVELKQRERCAVCLASVVPDVDGFGYFIELFTQMNSKEKSYLYSDYHHFFTHGILFGIFLFLFLLWLAKEYKWKGAILAFISFHFHVLGDVIGARGPDGFQWPIYYYGPITSKFGVLSWSGEWEINSWQNYLISFIALMITFYMAWKKGYSPVEMISKKGNEAFVKTLRNRFPFKEK